MTDSEAGRVRRPAQDTSASGVTDSGSANASNAGIANTGVMSGVKVEHHHHYRERGENVWQRLFDRRRSVSWLILAASVTFIAAAVAILATPRDHQTGATIVQEHGKSPTSLSPVVPAVGDGYAVTVNSNADVLARVGPSGALHYVVPPGRPTTPPSGNPVDCYNWSHQNGGEDFGVTVFQFTITAQSVQVVAESVELEVVEKRPPQPGYTVRCGGGDAIEGRFLVIDLNRQTGTFTYGSGDSGPSSKPFALLVHPNDAEQVQVIANTGDPAGSIGAFVWRLKLNLLVNGKQVTKVLDNNGQPFVTVARIGLAIVK